MPHFLSTVRKAPPLVLLAMSLPARVTGRADLADLAACLEALELIGVTDFN